MASFVKAGEHYYKSFDVFKKKTNEFFKNIEIIRDHIPAVILRLPHFGQERPYLNILSVGSGTGDMDVEIVRIVKEELQQSQGCHQIIKIYNRAIEPNEYPCDLYKAAVKRLDDQQIDFDVRQQTFEEYIKAEGAAEEERTKFDVIQFIHSIHYMDIEEALKLCIENEFSTNGSLLCIVADRPQLMYWVLEKQLKQLFPDRDIKPDDPLPERFKAAEKILEIARERGWKHEVHSQEYSIDVSDVFDEESSEGNLLLDFMTHIENFRETADKQLVKETLAMIKDLSTVQDGKRFGVKKESLIVIYK